MINHAIVMCVKYHFHLRTRLDKNSFNVECVNNYFPGRRSSKFINN